VYDRVPGPKTLVTVPNIKHYGIFHAAPKEVQRLAFEVR